MDTVWLKLIRPLSEQFDKSASTGKQKHQECHFAACGVMASCGVKRSVVRYPDIKKAHSQITVSRQIFSAESLTQTLQGQSVSHVTLSDAQRLVVQFANGTTFAADAGSLELHVAPKRPKATSAGEAARLPAQRQLEYLTFIHKYIARFGRAPAEADIERHFLVSAPSVNQMMQTLERLGFITRQRGVPRSVRICSELPQQV